MRIAFALPRREEFGFGRYLRSLLAALARIDRENDYLFFGTKEGLDGLAEVPARSERIPLPSLRPVFLWRRWILARALARSGADLVHYHNAAIGGRDPVPAVVTVHHVSFAYPPEEEETPWIERTWVRRTYRTIARRAARVITDSSSGAADLERLVGVPRERIRTVPLAADPAFRPPGPAETARVRRVYGLDGPYIFFAGQHGIRKNIPGMIRAVARFNAGRSAPHVFAVAGRPVPAVGYPALESGALDRPAVRPIGFVPAEDLPGLYAGATALLFLSRYEGFGLPLLEAFACGCPIVASNAGALPETAGGAARLIDPDDVEGAARALAEIADRPEARQDLVARGFARIREFSWERTARETLEVYREVLGAGKS